jgi:c-di-GMP-binding flagellar brake protein YcgR
MLGKEVFPKIGHSIWSWRKYFALERRRQFRPSAAIDVEFYVWNEAAEKPLTGKASGRIINISSKGACLKTNTARIGGHHLVINNNLEGKTPLILEFPSSPQGTACTLKSQILWYKRNGGEDKFKFEYGLQFIELSPTQQKLLQSLIT